MPPINFFGSRGNTNFLRTYGTHLRVRLSTWRKTQRFLWARPFTKSGGHHRASMAAPCVRATSCGAGGTSRWQFLQFSFEGLVPARSMRWEHSLTIVILYIKPFGSRACMKPEPRGVALGLLIAGFALAVVLAIAQVRPADLEAPGLKFVSPGIARK